MIRIIFLNKNIFMIITILLITKIFLEANIFLIITRFMITRIFLITRESAFGKNIFVNMNIPEHKYIPNYDKICIDKNILDNMNIPEHKYIPNYNKICLDNMNIFYNNNIS